MWGWGCDFGGPPLSTTGPLAGFHLERSSVPGSQAPLPSARLNVTPGSLPARTQHLGKVPTDASSFLPAQVGGGAPPAARPLGAGIAAARALPRANPHERPRGTARQVRATPRGMRSRPLAPAARPPSTEVRPGPRDSGQIQPLATRRPALHPRPATHLHASRGSRRNSFHAPSPAPRNETGAGRRADSAPDPALPSACQAPGTSSPPEPALPAPVQPAARRRCSGRRRAGEKASDLEPRAAEHAQSAAEPGRLPARRQSVPPGVPGGRGAGTADARPGTQLSPAGQLALGCAGGGDGGGGESFLFLETGTGDAVPFRPHHPPTTRRERWWVSSSGIRSPIRSQPESCAAKGG